MIEKKLFLEISGKRSDFHSAILTSFSFNFHHFEFQVLRTLRQKWVTNIAVLVDQGMLDESIGLASGNLKQLSESYSVNGIKSQGAFHPKLNFLVGDNKFLLFFGSGNISPGGHGKNHELFTAFYADSIDSVQRPLLIEAWEYLQSVTKAISGYNKERISRQVTANTTLLRRTAFEKHNFHKLENGIEVALLYNEERTSILSQIIRLIPKSEISKVTIVCPYYDDDGATLVALANQFNKAEFDIYVPNEFGLPPTKIPNQSRMNFYAWEATERSKENIGGLSTYVRKLHSKIFQFESERNQYFILGSANVTKAGFGSLEKRGVNDEFCALYKTSNVDFLKKIGIKGKKTRVDVKKMSRSPVIIADEGPSKRYKYLFYMTGADLLGYTLTIYLNSVSRVSGCSIVAYGATADELFKQVLSVDNSLELSIRLPNEVSVKKMAYVGIVDSTGKAVSNKQLINNIEKLSFTDPSKANRSINQIIYGFETGTVHEFEILEYLNELNSSSDVEHFRQKHRQSAEKEKPIVEMTYEEAVAASTSLQHKNKIATSHNSVRLWESISKLLQSTSQRRDDELDDEEEEATPALSNNRKAINNLAHQPNVGRVEKLIDRIQELVSKYNRSASTIANINKREIGVIDLAQFLVVSHVVTMLTYFNDGDRIDEKDWRQKLRNVFKHLMCDVLISFNKLLIGRSLEPYRESDKFYSERLKNYQAKAVYNSLFYIYLLDSLTLEHFVREKLELIAFNIFNGLGLSNRQFEQYLLDISRTQDEVRFNVPAAIRLKNHLEKKFFELGSNESYFWIDHSGVCLIKERNEKQISYISVQGGYNMSKNQYLRCKKRSSNLEMKS